MANQYLAFAATATDTFTPAAWAAMTGLLTNGFQTGIADTTEVNTLMRQLSVPISAIGQYISDAGFNANDDGSRANFQTALANALKKNLLASDQATWVQDKGGNNRLFMATNGTTTWKGYGTTPVTLQNAAGTTVFTAKDDGRVASGANATSGLDLITYQQWASGTNQYTNIINIPGNRGSTYYMIEAELGSLVILGDPFNYNLVLPQGNAGIAGKTVRVYNNSRAGNQPSIYAAGFPASKLYGPAFLYNQSYSGVPDYDQDFKLLPRMDYEFICDGTDWICLSGGTHVAGRRDIITRAAFLGGLTTFSVSRRQTKVMRITLVGGGGGGAYGGGGSGAVQIINQWIPPVTDPFTITSIGAGGTGGTPNGTSGGTTSITYPSSAGGWVCTAGGGYGATGTVGGAGGASTATVGGVQQHLSGNPGGQGQQVAGYAALGGAAPFFGGSGAAGVGFGSANRNGSVGGGGGGIWTGDGNPGNGGDGFIMIEEF